MRVWLTLPIFFSLFGLCACGSAPDRERNTMVGAGVGAGLGAGIAAATGNPGAILVGAAAGAVAGGAVGYFYSPEACYYRDAKGFLWQIPCQRHERGKAACFVGHKRYSMSEAPCREFFGREVAAISAD